MEPLATSLDIENHLGRLLTDDELARIDAVLADASAAVRSYTGQDFTASTTTERLRVRRGSIVLPQRPTSAVAAVEDLNANGLPYQWDGLDRLLLTISNLDSFSFVPWSRPIAVVDVTYTHGYDPIPDDIVGVVCSIVTRALGRRPEDAGIQQESIAGYSYTVGSAAAQGGFGMLPDEKAVLDRYRRVAGWVDGVPR